MAKGKKIKRDLNRSFKLQKHRFKTKNGVWFLAHLMNNQ